MSNADVSWIGGMARWWKDHGGALCADLSHGGASDAALRRLAAAMGRTRVLPFLRVCSGLWEAIGGLGGAVPGAEAVCRTYRRVAAVAWRDPIDLADLAVDGEDLRAAGVPGGPAIGQVLRGLLAVVLEDPTRNTREQLLAAVPGVRAGAG
jgi:tRNA nucleotidyltransferase (CCA-adding enzyme)